MLIEYRGIVHEVMGDAPFIGAIVIAPYCNIGCKGCHNQHLLSVPIQHNTATEILDIIQANKFNDGIILSGLEWTFTPDAMESLVREAVGRKMKVMIYTGLDRNTFVRKLPNLCTYLRNNPVWVKFGAYDQGKRAKQYVSCGITLASRNQYVKQYGEDDNKNG